MIQKVARPNVSRLTLSARAHNTAVKFYKSWQLWVLIAAPIVYLIIFKYVPMYGAQIAFKNFMPVKGIAGSPWVGFKHFNIFFHSYQFKKVLGNTIGLSLYQFAAGFPFPIILALFLNEIPNKHYRKSVQMITYAPYFISTVVLVSMVLELLAPRTGVLPRVLGMFIDLGKTPIMGRPKLFKTIYVISGIWQHTGYSSIIYIAVLSSIDPALHEAAIVDGATRLQRIRHINIPGLIPTIVILMILNLGRIMSVGFEKVYLFQNGLNMRTSEVISTYVYKVGLLQANYSFSAAIGLFNSVINLVLIVSVNKVAKTLGENSLW